MISVFTDGGSRGNPGPAAIGVYIVDEKNNVLFSQGAPIGIATNNIAEYKAVIAALTWLVAQQSLHLKHDGISFYLDSQLVCRQITQIYKVKNAALERLLFQIRALEQGMQKPIEYYHIPREKNKKADALVNRALDNQHIVSYNENGS